MEKINRGWELLCLCRAWRDAEVDREWDEQCCTVDGARLKNGGEREREKTEEGRKRERERE